MVPTACVDCALTSPYRLGEVAEAPPLSEIKWKCKRIDPEEGPVAEFIFRYRPLGKYREPCHRST